MKNITKILIAEHDPNDLELLHHELSKGGIKYMAEVVENEAGYINALKTFIPDIILAAYAFPSFNGRRAFKIKEQICPDTPFILVSGTIGEENSIELIKSGVTDFVLKDRLFTLNTKMARALKDAKERKQKNKTEKELVKSETHLAEAQKLAKMGSWDYDFNSGSVICSQELYNVFGVDKQTFIFTHGSYMDLIDQEDREMVMQISQAAQETGKPYSLEYGITTPMAEKRIISEHGHGHQDKHGKINRLIGTVQDITESKRSETALKKAYDEKNAVLESIEDGFFTVDKNSLVTYWNKKAETLLNKKRADVIGRNLHEIFGGGDNNIFYDNYKKATRDKTTVRFEAFSTRSNKWFAVSAFASDSGLSVYFKDVTEQKNDEEKIKESELRYRSIIEQATDAICIADASMKIIDINPYGCQMLGYSKEEFMQLTINDLFLAEDLIANPFKIEELRSGKVIRNERRFKSKDGTLIDVEMSGRILADGRFIVFGHDIAERKQADDKIKESELRYRSLHEQATDVICIADTSLRFIEINPYACEIFGYTRKEALQLYLSDVLFTEDIKDNPLKIPELKLGKTIRNERRLKRKDGTAVDMEVSTRIIEDGRMIIFGHDITERKKAEEASLFILNEKNTILESIDDAFFAVDKNWVVTYWNSQAEKVLRKRKDETLNHHLWDIFPDSVGSISYIKYKLAIETNQSVHFEDYYPPLAKWYEISAYPSGSGLSVYFKDVSERKIAEMQLSALNQNLNEHAKALAISNADLEQFAYVASHDLQEPLRMVTSFLSQLQKKYGAVIDDKGKQYIEFAVDGAKRMRQIILDLLEFSRVGRTEDKLEDIDLNELVDEMRILFRKQVQEKKAVIISKQLPHVTGYRSPIRQVFQNLISNALKYAGKDAVKINITCTDLNDHWQFAVSDNSIGIEQEYFDKIFIIFQRLHNKDEFSGTGMGLAITKKIIENQGGKIWVESEEGKGSTFYFTLLKTILL